MKFEKWTVALAAAGLVSLSSATKADEKPSAVMTALSSTAISGYVDTSAQWNFGSGAVNLPPYKFGGPSKADGFNLDVVQFRIEKPLDETDEWAAGYRVDLWAGPDANTLGTQSTLATGAGDFAIRQAYIALRMPIGNGLDWKVGVFDSVIGYESVESPLDPNYTGLTATQSNRRRTPERWPATALMTRSACLPASPIRSIRPSTHELRVVQPEVARGFLAARLRQETMPMPSPIRPTWLRSP